MGATFSATPPRSGLSCTPPPSWPPTACTAPTPWTRAVRVTCPGSPPSPRQDPWARGPSRRRRPGPLDPADPAPLAEHQEGVGLHRPEQPGEHEALPDTAGPEQVNTQAMALAKTDHPCDRGASHQRRSRSVNPWEIPASVGPTPGTGRPSPTDVEPDGPVRPVPGVAGDRLADVDHDCLDRDASSLTALPSSDPAGPFERYRSGDTTEGVLSEIPHRDVGQWPLLAVLRMRLPHPLDRQQWYIVSWLGGLAHQDGRAAYFDGQAEADAFAIELCRGHWQGACPHSSPRAVGPGVFHRDDSRPQPRDRGHLSRSHARSVSARVRVACSRVKRASVLVRTRT